ncbi:hypothetical protein CVN76_18390 [Bacillus sp. mrc49]|nr:hypothetical protein CVN76_18390 [Bacillus sp. mrc49]
MFQKNVITIIGNMNVIYKQTIKMQRIDDKMCPSIFRVEKAMIHVRIGLFTYTLQASQIMIVGSRVIVIFL